jgi:RHS repeat-associated protein
MKQAAAAACVWLMIWSASALGTCTDVPPTRVYGYHLAVTYAPACATHFKTLEEAEYAMRTDSGNSGAGAEALAFSVSGNVFSNPLNGSALLDYRPNGAVPENGSVLTGPPSSVTPAYSAYVVGWPALVPAVGCPASCSAGSCPTLADETALVQCEFDATWHSHANFAWTRQGGAQSTDAIASGPTQIAGIGQPTGALIYRPASSVAAGWGSTISITATQTGAQQAGASGKNAPNAVDSQTWIWNVQRNDTIACPAGATVSGSATSSADACHSPYMKVTVYPPTFTETPGTCGVGDPCFPANGNNQVLERGFRYGEIPLDLIYNSLRQTRPYGYIDRNWSHSLAKRVMTEWSTDGHIGGANGVDNPSPLSASYVIVQDEAAHQEPFEATPPGSGVFRSTATLGSVLVYHAATGNAPHFWELDREDGTFEIYDRTGRLVEIVHPDDPRKTLTLSYLGPPLPTVQYFSAADIPTDEAFWRLGSVHDGTGRSVTFHYSNDQYLWLTDVIADDGTTALLHFDYDASHRLQKLTFADHSSRQYLYNEPGNVFVGGSVPAGVEGYWLTGILDEANRRYGTFKYDDWGRVVASWHGVDAEKVTLSYAADAIDSKATATLPLGNQVTYAYSATEPYRHATAKTDSAGAWNYQYDPSTHRLKQTTDPNGNVTKIEYGSDDIHATARTEGFGTPEQRRIETDWDGVTQRIAARRVYAQPNNGAATVESKTSYSYDDATGRILTRTETGIAPKDGHRTWTYGYCASTDAASGCVAGLLHMIDGPQTSVSDVTTFKYYTSDDLSGCASGPSGVCHRAGDLQSVVDALGHVTTYSSYDRFGHAARIKDANGVVTDFAYTSRSWLTDRIVRANANGTPSAGDAATHIDYDAAGNAVKVTDPDGAYMSYQYDAARRLVKITDKLGNAIDYCPGGAGSQQCLDAEGHRVVEQTFDPQHTLRRSLSRAYDTLGRLVVEKDGLGHAIRDFGSVGVPTGYDANGNPTHWKDGNGVETVQQYDALDRLRAMIQDYGSKSAATAHATTSYDYDARGDLVAVTDPDDIATSYEYDPFGEVRSQTSADTGVTAYGYDPAGNRKSQLDANGVIAFYGHDVLNRLVGITYPTATLNVTFSYDQPNATTGCATSYPLGRLTRMTDHSGSTTYCYDQRGNVIRKTQVTSGVTATTSATYTPGDRLATLTYPSGAIVSYGRDGTGRVVSVQWRASANANPVTLVSSVTYYPFGPVNAIAFGNGRTLTKTYDLDYHVDAIQSSAADGLSLDVVVDSMGNMISIPGKKVQYDPLQRLTKIMSLSVVDEAYTYTKAGDRLTKALGGKLALNYLYDAGTHRLRSVTSMVGALQARAYDANGNLTDDKNGDTLAYDDRNRLVDATSPLGEYAYDYNGRGERVLQTYLPPHAGTATSTGFLYGESGLRLDEITYLGGAYASTLEYVYLDDLPIAYVSYPAPGSAGTPYYLETDHLGSPRVGVDPATNTKLWTWDFEESAFGENAPEGGGFISARFPGQFADGILPFYYNHAREYEPSTGQYIESDPIGLDGGVATYSYVDGNPLSRVDPNGTQYQRMCGRCTITYDSDQWKGAHTHWQCPGQPRGCIKKDGTLCDNSADPPPDVRKCLIDWGRIPPDPVCDTCQSQKPFTSLRGTAIGVGACAIVACTLFPEACIAIIIGAGAGASAAGG